MKCKIVYVEPCKNCGKLFRSEGKGKHLHYSGTGCICPACVDRINKMVNGY